MSRAERPEPCLLPFHVGLMEPPEAPQKPQICALLFLFSQMRKPKF